MHSTSGGYNMNKFYQLSFALLRLFHTSSKKPGSDRIKLLDARSGKA